MTYQAFSSRDLAAFEPSRSAAPQAAACAVALLLSASLGLALFYRHHTATSAFAPDVAASQVDAPHADRAPAPSQAAEASATERTTRPFAALAAPIHLRARGTAHRAHPASVDAALLDPTYTAGYAPMAFARSAPLQSAFAPLQANVEAPAVPEAEAPVVVASLQSEQDETQVVPALPMVSEIVRDVPLPARRPAFLAASRVAAAVEAEAEPRRATSAPPAPATGAGTLLERLFGAARPAVLAYAATGDVNGPFGRTPAHDNSTAVYDISAHTVYLPDGTRLEAHSGLGAAKDNPNSVTQHMRGATPPNTYELTEREALFHGVRALRLTPVAGTTYGREGLLAHTFMLGPRGDSNGCVVFRDYRAFLAAYDAGRIRRLVVVASVN